MRALTYFFTEAAASLWRGRASASLAMLTIAAGLFVLGFFLIVNTNLRHLVERWAQAAELSIYLRDDASDAQVKAVDDVISKSGLAASRQYVSKADAMTRFREMFPDLAGTASRLGKNPFPASFEVGLNDRARAAGRAVDTFATTTAAMPGVADVKYDRRWLTRLNSLMAIVRGVGLLIVGLLAVAAALTVANVVRLAAYARRDEIQIMQLVGAPVAYVRGPFVAEGILQGGGGAIVAIAVLAAVFAAARARYGGPAAESLGIGSLTFLPVELCLLLIAGGMLLGCIGGLVAARRVH
jgi:cell division transport system permease protein